MKSTKPGKPSSLDLITRRTQCSWIQRKKLQTRKICTASKCFINFVSGGWEYPWREITGRKLDVGCMPASSMYSSAEALWEPGPCQDGCSYRQRSAHSGRGKAPASERHARSKSRLTRTWLPTWATSVEQLWCSLLISSVRFWSSGKELKLLIPVGGESSEQLVCNSEHSFSPTSDFNGLRAGQSKEG